MSAMVEAAQPTPSEPPGRVRRRRTLRATVIAVALVVPIGVGAVFGSRLDADPTLVDTPLLGTVVTDQPLGELEGGTGPLRLSELRGRVVVLNYWASWCTQCRAEHPALMSVAATYRAAGVEFVGVVFQDAPENAIAFLDELGRGGPNYRNYVDPSSRAALDMGVYGVPETFVVAADGTVTAKITGKADFELLSGAIEAALRSAQPPAS